MGEILEKFGQFKAWYKSKTIIGLVISTLVVEFNELNGECTLVPELEPCPCEGCCDFNCCDELDFFMHKAYYDYYNTQFGTFMEFYNQWYDEFYRWWTSPVDLE